MHIDNTKLNTNIQFLIACCQSETSQDDIDTIRSFLNTERFKPNTLITLSNQHGILPLVYKTIKNLSKNTSSQSLSLSKCSTLNAFLSSLKDAYMQIAQRNMLMSAELIRIVQLLEENDIDALAFKGPTLAQMAYGDITLRQFGDLDILIRKDDRVKMIPLMTTQSYIPDIILKSSVQKTFLNSVNVMGFSNTHNNVHIEIHWELLSKNYAIDWDEKDLWSQKETVEIKHNKIAILPTEQFLLYICAHGSKHLFERLEWICDIDRTIRSNPGINWKHLLIEADNRGISRMVNLGLALSQALFKLNLPEIIQEHIDKDREIPQLIAKVIEVNFSQTSQEGKNHSSFRVLWSMREKFSDRIRFAWRGLFTPKFDDFVFIQLPRHIAFFYPLVRTYRLLKKYFRH